MFFYYFSWQIWGHIAQLKYFASSLLAVGCQTHFPLLLLSGLRHPRHTFPKSIRNPCLSPGRETSSCTFSFRQYLFSLFIFPSLESWWINSSVFGPSTILRTFSFYPYTHQGFSLVAQLVKNLPSVRETWVQSLGWEDPLEKGKATHSSILAWRIPWTVQSMGSQRVGHDWVIFTSLFFVLILWWKNRLRNVVDSVQVQLSPEDLCGEPSPLTWIPLLSPLHPASLVWGRRSGEHGWFCLSQSALSVFLSGGNWHFGWEGLLQGTLLGFAGCLASLKSETESSSGSVMSDSLWPHGLYSP